ncbi:thioesterase II family protein [Aliikangiella sp. IMCC44359]|uniref:thioesterase II family protein n=1 Tax=Aliikangiella sp. IMCC44359 TaxID=3459125 RepID=UPI00403ACA97
MKSSWLVKFNSNPNAKLRLICFPYAGGSAAIYRNWAKHIEMAEVLCVQPPGRGERIGEPVIGSIEKVVEQLVDVLKNLDDKPFIFFGHSNGALISFEVAREMRRQSLRLPEHMILSAKRAPQLIKNQKISYNLPEEEFIEKVRNMKGTPEEVLNNKEIMQILLPLLRADFQISETYKFKDEEPLNIPFTLLGGVHDENIPEADVGAWEDNSAKDSIFIKINGGHFFIHSHETQVIAHVKDVLKRSNERLLVF